MVSGSRLELNRLDRLDHESLARACGLRDDDCVLGGAHSEDHARTLAELQGKGKVTSIGSFALTILVRRPLAHLAQPFPTRNPDFKC